MVFGIDAAKMLKRINPIKYYAVGILDLLMSMDINKKVQIAVISQ